MKNETPEEYITRYEKLQLDRDDMREKLKTANNQVQQYREALRRIERQSRILSESNSPFTINEIAKKALTSKEES